MAPHETAWVLVYLHFKVSYVANMTNTSEKNFFSDNLTFSLQYFVYRLINVLNLTLVPNLSFLNFVFLLLCRAQEYAMSLFYFLRVLLQIRYTLVFLSLSSKAQSLPYKFSRLYRVSCPFLFV